MNVNTQDISKLHSTKTVLEYHGPQSTTAFLIEIKMRSESAEGEEEEGGRGEGECGGEEKQGDQYE